MLFLLIFLYALEHNVTDSKSFLVMRTVFKLDTDLFGLLGFDIAQQRYLSVFGVDNLIKLFHNNIFGLH
jgi:hypothetical protein